MAKLEAIQSGHKEEMKGILDKIVNSFEAKMSEFNSQIDQKLAARSNGTLSHHSEHKASPKFEEILIKSPKNQKNPANQKSKQYSRFKAEDEYESKNSSSES